MLSSSRRKKFAALWAMAIAVGLAVGVSPDWAAAGGNKPPKGGGGAEPTHYIVDLGTLGGSQCHVSKINEAGQVIGYAARPDGYWDHFVLTPEDTDGDGAPDLWFRDDDGDGANDLMDDLSLLGFSADARNINDAGDVIGWAQTDGGPFSFLWRDTNGDGQATPDEAVNLGRCDGLDAAATAINNLGQIAGQLYGVGGPPVAFLLTPKDTNHDGAPDLWYEDTDDDGNNDLIIPLGGMPYDPNAQSSPDGGIWVHGINDAGWIIGSAWTLGVHYNNENHAFLLKPEDNDGDGQPDTWYADTDDDPLTNELMVDLGTLGGSASSANAINADGKIVGSATGSDQKGNHPVCWEVAADGSIALTELGIPKGASYASAVDINDGGQVVGSGGRTSKNNSIPVEPFLWQNGKATALESLVVDMGGFDDLDYAMSINNAGQIVGWELIGDSYTDPVRAYIALPLPTESAATEAGAAQASALSDGSTLCPSDEPDADF